MVCPLLSRINKDEITFFVIGGEHVAQAHHAVDTFKYGLTDLYLMVWNDLPGINFGNHPHTVRSSQTGGDHFHLLMAPLIY